MLFKAADHCPQLRVSLLFIPVWRLIVADELGGEPGRLMVLKHRGSLNATCTVLQVCFYAFHHIKVLEIQKIDMEKILLSMYARMNTC